MLWLTKAMLGLTHFFCSVYRHMRAETTSEYLRLSRRILRNYLCVGPSPPVNHAVGQWM